MEKNREYCRPFYFVRTFALSYCRAFAIHGLDCVHRPALRPQRLGVSHVENHVENIDERIYFRTRSAIFLARANCSLRPQLPTFCTAKRTLNAGIAETFVGQQRQYIRVLVFGSVFAVASQYRSHERMRQVGLDEQLRPRGWMRRQSPVRCRPIPAPCSSANAARARSRCTRPPARRQSRPPKRTPHGGPSCRAAPA